MPSHLLHPYTPPTAAAASPLPQLLHTPSGLALVEIQGKLHQPERETGEACIGEFVFDRGDDTKCWLYVGGTQRLRGEVRKLGVPLGVLGRRGGEGEVEVEVVEVVRYKVVFGSRPEPVTGGV